MSTYVGENKQQLSTRSTDELKEMVCRDAWIALRQYFCGAGNGPEAKVSCVVITTLTREFQARNNARSLDLLERRLAIESGSPIRIPAPSSSEEEK
jgi:hypothetical protein